LISSSSAHGSGYLDHCAGEIRRLLAAAGARRALFVPWALADHEAYTAKAAARFAAMEIALEGIPRSEDAAAAVRGAESLFVGGGNTFRLLAALYAHSLLEEIRARVSTGMPYIGTSAGTNVACPTIRTTNDMPIVSPPSLDALSLVRYQINPHYLDPDPASTHQGETREERLRQYHEENALPVVGLREGAMIAVDGGRSRLVGEAGARIFRRGEPPQERRAGQSLDDLLPGDASAG
jgi:dipeptidase E